MVAKQSWVWFSLLHFHNLAVLWSVSTQSTVRRCHCYTVLSDTCCSWWRGHERWTLEIIRQTIHYTLLFLNKYCNAMESACTFYNGCEIPDNIPLWMSRRTVSHRQCAMNLNHIQNHCQPESSPWQPSS